MVAVGLSAVALTSFAAFNRFQLFALRNQATQIELQGTARTVLDLIAREIRRAGMDPTCTKSFEGIASATFTSIQIKQDLDGSGGIGGTNEDITYRYNYSTQAFERVAGGQAETLLSDVGLDGSGITYFDSDGAQLGSSSSALTTAQRAAVRRVRVQFALAGANFDSEISNPLRAQVSTDIDLRNRFFLNSTVCP